MPFLKNLFVYGAAISICLRVQGDNPDSTQVSELKSKALSLEKAFQGKRIDLGYPANPQQVGKTKVLEISDVDYEENTLELRSDNYWVLFLERNGKFLGLSDHYVMSKQFDKGAPEFTTKNKPNWPPEKAVSVAKPFFDAFLNDKNFFFAAPTAMYTHTMPDKEGVWEVEWTRTDSKGHLFDQNEYVAVWISESNGPYGLTVRLAANYTEPSGEQLKPADLQGKAREVAKRTLSWGPVKAMLDPGHLDPNAFMIQLRIVKPNHLLDHQEINTHADLNARLAWIFWFAWRLDNDPKQIQSVSVWIDAYTGEVLGGDAAMN